MTTPILLHMLSRQADMVADPSNKRVAIIGCGGIGSNAAHVLASMGYRKFTFVDHDVVAAENTHPAYLHHWLVGRKKVDALAQQLIDALGRDDFDIQVVDTRVQEWLGNHTARGRLERPEFDLTVLGLDSLEARRQAVQGLRDMQMTEWIADGRMGGYTCQLYCANLYFNWMQSYLQTLEGEDAPLLCGMKATSPLTKGWLAGMIGLAGMRIANEENDDGTPPPYFQQYDLRNGLLITLDRPNR